MSLTGDVNTLALSDLVQVSAMNHRTCQIHVIAPHAEGDLFLERGSVVHAWWGDLVGAEAVYAMQPSQLLRHARVLPRQGRRPADQLGVEPAVGPGQDHRGRPRATPRPRLQRLTPAASDLSRPGPGRLPFAPGPVS